MFPSPLCTSQHPVTNMHSYAQWFSRQYTSIASTHQAQITSTLLHMRTLPIVLLTSSNKLVQKSVYQIGFIYTIKSKLNLANCHCTAGYDLLGGSVSAAIHHLDPATRESSRSLQFTWHHDCATLLNIRLFAGLNQTSKITVKVIPP